MLQVAGMVRVRVGSSVCIHVYEGPHTDRNLRVCVNLHAYDYI